MDNDSIDAYLDQLATIGWTDGWSPDAVLALRDQISWWQDQDARHRYLALASGSYDAECIDDDQSYSGLLRIYAEGSNGAFEPTDVESAFANDGEMIRLAFTLRGRRFDTMLPFGGWDYVDEGLEPFLNESLGAVGERRVFFSLPPVDQSVYFACVLPGAYRKAEEAGLLPSFPPEPPEPPEDPEARETARRLVAANRSGDREAIIESMRALTMRMLGTANEKVLQEHADRVLKEREKQSRSGGSRGGA